MLERSQIIMEDYILESSEIFVGVDVSKAQLDIAIRPTGEKQSFANDKVGIKTLVTQLAKFQPTLIVLEATGGYERLALRALLAPNCRPSISRTGQTAKAAGGVDRLHRCRCPGSPLSSPPQLLADA
jgi:transposase